MGSALVHIEVDDIYQTVVLATPGVRLYHIFIFIPRPFRLVGTILAVQWCHVLLILLRVEVGKRVDSLLHLQTVVHEQPLLNGVVDVAGSLVISLHIFHLQVHLALGDIVLVSDGYRLDSLCLFDVYAGATEDSSALAAPTSREQHTRKSND